MNLGRKHITEKVEAPEWLPDRYVTIFETPFAEEGGDPFPESILALHYERNNLDEKRVIAQHRYVRKEA